MQAFCGAVERLLELEIPPRAAYLRVIHMELNRIHSHLVGLGTTALDLGAISMFWYCFRERDTDPRPVRDVVGAAHAHALLPGRRRDRGHPGGLRAQGARVLRRHAGAHRPVRGAARPERDLPPADAQHGRRLARAPAGARRDRAAAARRGRAVGPAQAHRRPALQGLRLPDPDRHDRRQLRPLPGPPQRDARVDEDHPPGGRGAARGPVLVGRPQGRAAPAARARHLDGGADPPLQARHRGLPGAAGRDLLPDRGPARRARLLRRRRRVGEAGARPHARPLLHQPAGAARHVHRPSTWPT